MKKQSGFSLAELVISMGIFVLIIGAIVALFATSIKAMVYGRNQEAAYAEARAVMNDLTTTLRYADGPDESATGKNKIEVDNKSTQLEYHGTMTIGNDPSNEDNEKREYKRRITMETKDGVKRLKIEWTGFYPGQKDPTSNKDAYTDDKVVYFPANTKNAAFDNEEYLAVYNSMLADAGITVSGIPFPIYKATYQGGKVFNIALPIKYAFEGGSKVEVLRSRVTTDDYEEKTTTESRFAEMTAKNQDLINRVLATTPPGNVGGTWRSQDLLWRWLNLTDQGNITGPGYEKVTDEEIKEMFTDRGLTLPKQSTPYYWRPLYTLIDEDVDTGETDGKYSWTSDIWFVSKYDTIQNHTTNERNAFAIYWKQRLYLPVTNVYNPSITTVAERTLTTWTVPLIKYKTYNEFWQALGDSSKGFVYVGKVSF